MKLALFAITILMAGTASATLTAGIPKKITCTSAATSKNAQKFDLMNLGSIKANSSSNSDLQIDSTIADSSPLLAERAGKMLTVGFSNECDNSYGITFDRNDLIALNMGRVKSITAKMVYSDAHLNDEKGQNGNVEETLDINCTL